MIPGYEYTVSLCTVYSWCTVPLKNKSLYFENILFSFIFCLYIWLFVCLLVCLFVLFSLFRYQECGALRDFRKGGSTWRIKIQFLIFWEKVKIRLCPRQENSCTPYSGICWSETSDLDKQISIANMLTMYHASWKDHHLSKKQPETTHLTVPQVTAPAIDRLSSVRMADRDCIYCLVEYLRRSFMNTGSSTEGALYSWRYSACPLGKRLPELLTKVT